MTAYLITNTHLNPPIKLSMLLFWRTLYTSALEVVMTMRYIKPHFLTFDFDSTLRS